MQHATCSGRIGFNYDLNLVGAPCNVVVEREPMLIRDFLLKQQWDLIKHVECNVQSVYNDHFTPPPVPLQRTIINVIMLIIQTHLIIKLYIIKTVKYCFLHVCLFVVGLALMNYSKIILFKMLTENLVK